MTIGQKLEVINNGTEKITINFQKINKPDYK